MDLICHLGKNPPLPTYPVQYQLSVIWYTAWVHRKVTLDDRSIPSYMISTIEATGKFFTKVKLYKKSPCKRIITPL